MLIKKGEIKHTANRKFVYKKGEDKKVSTENYR